MPLLPALSAAAVRAALKEYNYPAFGLRRLDWLPADDEVLGPSQVFDREEPTGEYLPGTSALRLRKNGEGLDRVLRVAAEEYGGQYAVLLGADNYQQGEDDGEIVMIDPVVLERWSASENT